MRSETPTPQDGPTPSSRSFIETARRRQLIDAAVATVNEVGYHRASLAEFGKRAGIVKSAIGYYFSSKEALLLELVQEAFTALGESVLGAVPGREGAAARLRAYAEAHLAHVDAAAARRVGRG